MYKKVKDGVFYNPKFGRIMEHRGYSTRIFWNTQMLEYLKKNYARTLNDDLAEWLGVSQSTMSRKAKELGLKKDTEWLSAVWEERRKMAHMVARHMGYPGGFRKGQRANPNGEFKAGRKPSAEELAKKSEGMKRWYRRHPSEASAKALKAWETRRNKLVV